MGRKGSHQILGRGQAQRCVELDFGAGRVGRDAAGSTRFQVDQRQDNIIVDELFCEARFPTLTEDESVL
jgi:hypothetical protein